MIKITLPDGSVREYESGIKVIDVANDISTGLARVILGAKANGKAVGLDEVLTEDTSLELLKFDSEEARDIFRHTSSHILAQAVKRLYPDVKLAIGPAIKDGFYYDFDTEHKFTPDDFAKIEAEMKKIAKEDLKIERFVLPRDEAIEKMKEMGEDYKVELIEDLPEGEIISFYKQGDFVDLCAGPHLQSTKKVKAVKILSIAGAYWRGNENNKMLQRLYATSFEKKKDLDLHLERLEEAKKRDHRKLGQELDLFSMNEAGVGFPFFHAKGMALRNVLEDLWRKEHVLRGYGEIKTPIILNEALWHTSGHWDHYQENMYFTKIDDMPHAIKPMNCPGSMLVYKNNRYSYRDLPIRMAELGLVHRHELSGTLHGLMRVRTFTQDDAHIFMLPEQIRDEVLGVLKFADDFYNLFGFKYSVELSTRPEDSMGTDEEWALAENSLKDALESAGLEYHINPGDGAFYGPKIDLHLEDAIGRTWQCGTIQLDMQMPQRFDLNYVGKDGEKHRPVMVHRVIFGSIERFIGILIEHFAGKFPLWLAPVQVTVLPISDKYNDYAYEVKKQLMEKQIRVDVDDRAEKTGYKIREAQLQKIPYMLIVGEKEAQAGTVAIRDREEGDIGAMNVQEFVDMVVKKSQDKQ